MEVKTSVNSSEKLCNGSGNNGISESVEEPLGKADKVQFILNLKNGKVNGVHMDSEDKEEAMEIDAKDENNKAKDVENGDKCNDLKVSETASEHDLGKENGDQNKSKKSSDNKGEGDEKMDIESDMDIDTCKTEVDNKNHHILKVHEKDISDDHVLKEHEKDISDESMDSIANSGKDESFSKSKNQTEGNNVDNSCNIVESKRVDDEKDEDTNHSESKDNVDSASKDHEKDDCNDKEAEDTKEASMSNKEDNDDESNNKSIEKEAEEKKGDKNSKKSKKADKIVNEKDTVDGNEVKNTEKDIDLTNEKVGEKKKTPPKPSRISAALKPSPVSAQLRPMAGLLFDLGMDLARQTVYKDLIRIQMKKQSMDKLDDKETRQLDKLKEAYDDLVSKNDPYLVDTNIDCDQCEFKGDLNSVLENHKEYGHVQDSGLIKCSYCDEHFRASHPFLVHMDQKHKKKGRVLARHSFFVCPFCPFEHNSKASFNKHILRCERLFNLARNLEPTPADCDIPIKLPKPPVTAATVVKSKPQVNAAAAAQAAMQAAKKDSMNSARGVPSQSPRPPNKSPSQQAATQPRPPVMVTPPNIPGAQMVQVGSQWYTMVNVNGQRFLTPIQAQVNAAAQQVSKSPVTPTQKTSQKPGPKPSLKQNSKSVLPSQLNKTKNLLSGSKNKDKGGTFEICEICGGFVKDRESLRIHFYWAHKVDIHKDVFNKGQPNLVCDKCNFRAWTVQGLARHRNMAHKENLKGKDKARLPFYCMLCRPSPELLHTETFWLHMAAKHNIGPESIFNYPHCVVCGVPNIGVPRALETHMLNIHSQLFSVDLLELARKLVASKPAASKQGAASAAPPLTDSRKQQQQQAVPIITCEPCGVMLQGQFEYEQHCRNKHLFKCSRCTNSFPSREVLLKHFHDQHKDEKDHCPICDDIIPIGRPLVRHMRSNHMKKCSVHIRRLPKAELDQRIAKYREYYGTPIKSPSRSRKRSFLQPPSVIIVEESPVKKSRTSATRMGVSEGRRKKQNHLKEVINVDGEDILVEMQQDEDDEEESTDTVESSPEKSKENEDHESPKKIDDLNEKEGHEDKDKDAPQENGQEEKKDKEQDEEALDTEKERESNKSPTDENKEKKSEKK